MEKIIEIIRKNFSKVFGFLVFIAFVGGLCLAIVAFAFRLYSRNSGTMYSRNRSAVTSNWGSSLKQSAPKFENYFDEEDTLLIKEGKLDKASVQSNVKILRSKINADIKMDYRRKGLTYFPTFVTNFNATYTIKNSNERRVNASFVFPLLGNNNLVWDVVMTVGGLDTGVNMDSNGLSWKGRLDAGEEKEVVVSYMARGMENFSYALSGTKGLQDFEMDMVIDGVEMIDIPSSSLSPSMISEDEEKKVRKLSWKFEKVLTSPKIEVTMYSKKNLYEQVGRLIFGAAVMLPVYLGLLFIYSRFVKKNIGMFDYGLVASVFCSFYPLFSYLTSIVEKFDIYSNLIISAGLVSVILVLHVWQLLGSSGVMYGVLVQALFFGFFPYAILNPEYTGLLVTLGLILILSVIVVLRGKVIKKN